MPRPASYTNHTQNTLQAPKEPNMNNNTKEAPHGTQQRSLRDRVGISIHAIRGIDPPTFVDRIVQAEQAGVRNLWATQGAASTDLLTAYAAAFMRTSEIRLGTSIVPAYPRHPLVLAQQAATAGAFGPDRLRLGVGTSHRSAIENVYGLKMERALAYLREYVEILRAALWEGSVDHQGQFFTARTRLNNPRKVPIMVAALGETAFRQAGEISDGAISWNAPARYLLDVALPGMREGAATAGRPTPPLLAYIPVALTTDIEAARATARKDLSVYTRLPFYTNMWATAGYPLQPDGSVSDDLIDNLVMIGEESTVASRLTDLVASGIDEFLLASISLGDPDSEHQRLTHFIGNL